MRTGWRPRLVVTYGSIEVQEIVSLNPRILYWLYHFCSDRVLMLEKNGNKRKSGMGWSI